MLTSRYKTRFIALTAGPARGLIALRISPDVLTWCGVIGTALSCAYYLLVQRNTLLFCGLVLACGLCDAMDGAVARLSWRTSRWGSYLDAMADRAGETMIALTVAVATGYWLLISALLAGSLLISYAKARAGMEVAISNTEWPDMMERTERGLIFLAGLAASALVPRLWRGHDIFWWSLVGLVAAVYATLLQRIARARRLIRTRASGMHDAG